MVTDKNGIQTIRWKRPVATRNKSSGIPAVQSVAFVSKWDALRKDDRKVSRSLLTIMARAIKSKSRRETMLSQLGPDTLNILNKKYGNIDDRNLIAFLNHCSASESPISINNAAALIECADEPQFNINFSSSSAFFKCVSGLRSYEGAEDIDYSTLDDAQRKSGRALLNAASLLNGRYRSIDGWKGESPQYIRSNNLASLISRRPDDVEKIVSTVQERGLDVDTPAQIALVEEIINSSSSAALLSGAL
jgi:hypothetical protein